MEVGAMDKKELRKYREIQEIWDEEFEEKFDFFNTNDVMDEFQNK